MIGVAISGKLASGKTTAAKVLIEEFGFQRMSLAEPLKRAAKQIVDFFSAGLPDWRDRAENDIFEYIQPFGDKTTQQGRRFLQFLGTDVMRAAYPDVWVGAFLWSLRSLPATARIVVDDVRFQNEIGMLQRKGFFVVRVEMPEELRLERIKQLYPGYDEASLTHVSETDLDSWKGWDLVLDGSTPIEEFRKSVRGWVDWKVLDVLF